MSALVVVAALALTGLALQLTVVPVRRMADREVPGRGEGLTLAVLGGFRGIAADLVWLRAFVLWERREAEKTEALLRLATAMDPRPAYFWLNGARMIAYDLPVWRIQAEGGLEGVPLARQRQIRVEQARRALAFLDRGAARHAGEPAYWIERANIELNGLRDTVTAAESYRRAAVLPGAPYFAARLHAQLLWQAGRSQEALAALTRLHPILPLDDERAAAGLVLERIRRLERELGVPAEHAYRTDAGK